MDKNRMQEAKAALEKEKERLEQDLSSFAKKDPKLKNDWDSKYPRVPEGGLEEAANEVEEYSTRVSVEHELELKLRAVNEALGRIQKGTYGTCGNCGSAIKEDRLAAYPEISLCESCSAKRSI
ncbi:MAG: hypothetical protein Q8P39_02250 [Candidatus Yanofskybacteria bacterium]|nr:hypothetical protein [Candidatus Yanofskybacteria bacterium]